jgi:light-regulated signal transduction histidine kinase (bacteriophytochrome)
MVTTELPAPLPAPCKTAPRVLIVNQGAQGEDFSVQEIVNPPTLASSSQESSMLLNDWLVANQRCPCAPRKSAEQELARKVEELARSNRELEQFAFVASHDLQEPLRMVAAYTQLLAERYRGKLDPEADRYIGYASEGALRLQTLIHDLLAYSRVSHSDVPAREVGSMLAVEAALNNLRHAIAESGAVTHCGLLPAVYAERSQLTQVFQNLIGNAVKFRKKEAPVISIQAERLGNDWVFSVSDNGVGIASEYNERIFDLFQRLHTRAEYEGNGIGLSICKRIVERFGGRIWVESKAGEGSTFKFSLPAVSNERNDGRPLVAGAPAAQSQGAQL